jgi:hypothetical protein
VTLQHQRRVGDQPATAIVERTLEASGQGYLDLAGLERADRHRHR